MTVVAVDKSVEDRTITFTAEFDAPVARVWQLWENPRLLERWWGPPTWPARVVDHDMRPGGTVSYYMTGPEGDRAGGLWSITNVEPPHRLEFEDAFADDDGNLDLTMPTMTVHVDLTERADGGTRMTVSSRFPSEEAMEQILAMGAEEGMRLAMGQMDDLLREAA